MKCLFDFIITLNIIYAVNYVAAMAAKTEMMIMMVFAVMVFYFVFVKHMASLLQWRFELEPIIRFYRFQSLASVQSIFIPNGEIRKKKVQQTPTHHKMISTWRDRKTICGLHEIDLETIITISEHIVQNSEQFSVRSLKFNTIINLGFLEFSLNYSITPLKLDRPLLKCFFFPLRCVFLANVQ